MTKIFKTSNGFISDLDFERSIEKLDLLNKDVLVYSRLFSLGRPTNKESVKIIINILKRAVGPEGTLIFPTYTLNSYKEPRVFDFRKSKIMSGVLGEVSLLDEEFERTIHPVYSNSIYGKNKEFYQDQKITTCFGENSFFDLFSKVNNSCVLMLGLNFNGPTFYHYYDQKFSAEGRFIKNFCIRMKIDEHTFSIDFSSYVKDHLFYNERMNCLARFDSVANLLGYITRFKVGDGSLTLIREEDFQILYKTALNTNQKYFLTGTHEEWKEYYLKNNNSLMDSSLDPEIINEFKMNLKE